MNVSVSFAYLTVYRASTALLSLVLPFYLRHRVKVGKEDAIRIGERSGKTDISRPCAPLVWLHAASVGESIMLLPLIFEMKRNRPDIFILLTTGTLTSAKLMAQRLPAGCIHQFAPADTRTAVRAFLDHWKPDFAIWAESELWPNLIIETRSRGIKTALINARMGKKSLKRWKKQANFARLLLSEFNPILAADTSTASGISDILDRRIPVLGNLKYAAPPFKVKYHDEAELSKSIGARPVWAATSTHEGEEIWIAQAHKKVKADNLGALLILAPRHPERADVIKAELMQYNFNIAQRSKSEAVTAHTDVYLFDTLGELGLVYALSPVSVLGGSLVPGLSGHNPLEPARLGSAIISGTNVNSFDDIYADMVTKGAVKFVHDASELARSINALLLDENDRKSQVKVAKTFSKSQDGLLELVWTALVPYMPPNVSLQ